MRPPLPPQAKLRRVAVGLALIGIAGFVVSAAITGVLWLQRPVASGASFPEWARPHDGVVIDGCGVR